MHVSFTARHFRFKRFSRYNVLYRSTSHHTLYRNGIIKDGSRCVHVCMYVDSARRHSKAPRISLQVLRAHSSILLGLALDETWSMRDDSGCNGGHFNNAKPTVITNRAPYRGDGWRTIALSLQSVVIRSKRSDV